MAIVNLKATYESDIQSVWEIVTTMENYMWRTDLSKIEVTGKGRFVEYTNDGYATDFTVTVFEPCRRYEFDMENKNMRGHWTGIFSEEDGRSTIDFTEEVQGKKWFMKPFVKLYLKKQQAAYAHDLKIALEKK